MQEGISREELKLLIASLDETMALLEARLKRVRAENRSVTAVLRELQDVRARRDQLLEDLASLPPDSRA